jgi:anaerobic ribonucleoside-triphosphate reductase activating protein
MTEPRDHVLNLHAVLPRSRANGPGVRFAVWFQGCSLRCPGCFNPDTHSTEPRLLTPVSRLLDDIAACGDRIDGVSLSGGEPLQQPDGLLALTDGIRNRTDLSVLLFSGYTLPEIDAMPLGPKILRHLDVLIAGRFDVAQRLTRGLRGSDNQRVHLLTDRYTMQEIEAAPSAEVHVAPDGTVTVSGIGPPHVR